MTQTVIVTGASGFIGGQTAIQLKSAGYQVVGIDLLSPTSELSVVFDEFFQGNFASDVALRLVSNFNPIAIIHCAGTSLVGPSVLNPEVYYQNNFVRTKVLLDYIIANKLNIRMIFSSSASVYGEPIMTPCHEVDPSIPVSPYGESKHMVEMMLNSYHRAYGLDFVAFRYFNACGADSQARHGQRAGATHIIARVLESIYTDSEFTLNGTDFPTEDGTCIRDYVHVEDIANAHVLAVGSTVPAGTYNLGNNIGTSNQQIIKVAEQVTGKTLKVKLGPQRAGDPAHLTASSDKFNEVAGNWKKFNLEDMVSHAWTWQKARSAK